MAPDRLHSCPSPPAGTGHTTVWADDTFWSSGTTFSSGHPVSERAEEYNTAEHHVTCYLNEERTSSPHRRYDLVGYVQHLFCISITKVTIKL